MKQNENYIALKIKDAKPQKQPLYKSLNNCRTQGNWKHKSRSNGDEEIVTDIPVYEAGSTIFEVNFENKDYEANAEYATLAVNNLQALAGALHNMVVTFEALNDLYKTKFATKTIREAKEALRRIS